MAQCGDVFKIYSDKILKNYHVVAREVVYYYALEELKKYTYTYIKELNDKFTIIEWHFISPHNQISPQTMLGKDSEHNDVNWENSI